MPDSSPFPFHVKEHVVEAQHVREYPRATAHSQEEVLQLAVKQYMPKSNPDPQAGDVTLIASHANGFPKVAWLSGPVPEKAELYEPLFEDLLSELGKHGIRVRGIWIADVAWQGQSGILNEEKLGNDPAWFDHARDLLLLINQFRREMPRPLVGLGHSFGATITTHLALLHPRLLSALVLLDPVLRLFRRPGQGPETVLRVAQLSARRRDVWPSRADAAAAFRRNPFYQTWDPRVLAAWLRHGLRDTPTALHPRPGQVTLVSTKHMETFTYFRPLAQARDARGRPVVDPDRLPDISPKQLEYLRLRPGQQESNRPQGQQDEKQQYPAPEEFSTPFYRPEGWLTAERLPNLRPGVLWLYGGESSVCPPDARAEHMALTGVGTGGSGGAAAGRVHQVVVDGLGHLVPLEAPRVCAAHAAAFLAPELERWRREEDEFRAWADGDGTPEVDRKRRLDEDYMRLLASASGETTKQPAKERGKL